jgi:hypothetical protein
MRLVDSNIIIYATAPENEWLRTWLEVEPFGFGRSELLGHPKDVAENGQKFRKAWDDYLGNR